MSTLFRSIGAGLLLAGAILVFIIGVLSPYLPQDVIRPAWHVQRTLRFDEAAPLHLYNAEGHIRIDVHDGGGIIITADIRTYAPPSAQPQDYDGGTLEARTDSGGLHVGLVTEAIPASLSVQADFTVLVPESNDVVIEGGNGNVYIGAGCGAVSITGNNADILVERPRDDVEALVTNGRIRVYDAPAETHLETVNGSIFAHMRGGSLDARTTNGYIGATLLAAGVERCDLTSTNGGITLALAADCSAEVDAATERGAVRSYLPFRGETLDSPKPRTFQGRIYGSEEEPPVDRPPCRVTMRSRNGNLSIRKSGS